MCVCTTSRTNWPVWLQRLSSWRSLLLLDYKSKITPKKQKKCIEMYSKPNRVKQVKPNQQKTARSKKTNNIYQRLAHLKNNYQYQPGFNSTSIVSKTVRGFDYYLLFWSTLKESRKRKEFSIGSNHLICHQTSLLSGKFRTNATRSSNHQHHRQNALWFDLDCRSGLLRKQKKAIKKIKVKNTT